MHGAPVLPTSPRHLLLGEQWEITKPKYIWQLPSLTFVWIFPVYHEIVWSQFKIPLKIITPKGKTYNVPCHPAAAWHGKVFPLEQMCSILSWFERIGKRLNDTYVLALEERNWFYVDLFTVSYKKYGSTAGPLRWMNTTEVLPSWTYKNPPSFTQLSDSLMALPS